MAKKPETRLQQRIQRALRREVGGWWVKIHGGPFQKAGLPDLIGCVHGLFFGIEVKRPDGGDPTPIQIETLADIRDLGEGFACVVTSPRQAIQAVRRALQKAR